MESFRKLENVFFPAYPFQAQYNSVSYDFMFFKVKNNENTIINGYKISLLLIGTKTVNLWGFHVGRE